MKSKVLGLSIFSFILFLFIQFSNLEVSSQVKGYINRGNDFYAEEQYKEASGEFLDALVLTSIKETAFDEEENQLNSNLGMTSYRKEQYLEANEYFDLSVGNNLLRGNGYYYLGEIEQDPELKLEYYSKALNMYKDGILENPRDLDLKYNYEFVLEKLNQEKQEQEGEESQESEEGEEDQESQEGEEGQEDQESQEGEEGQEDQESQEGEEGQEDQGSQEDQQDQVLDGELTEESYEELLKILELLEQQEEESLKNNQEVIQEGSGDTNDW